MLFGGNIRGMMFMNRLDMLVVEIRSNTSNTKYLV